jgi:hypothetical protein
MKKLSILLVALVVLAAIPSFSADVTMGGDFRAFSSYDFVDAVGMASVARNRVFLTAMVDDFTTVRFAPVVSTDQAIGLYEFSLKSDFGKALNLPFSLVGTFGHFENYFTGWWAKDSSAWAHHREWPNGVLGAYQTDNGAMRVDAGFGPVNVHWWNDAIFENFVAGVDASFAGVGLWLAYGSAFADFGGGGLNIEAKYDLAFGDVTGLVAGYFRYCLGPNSLQAGAAGDWIYGANVGVGYGMFGVAAGLTGNIAYAVDNVVAEVTLAPIDPAKIAVAFFMGNGEFYGVDISANYMVGPAMFGLGFVIAGDDAIGGEPYVFTGGGTYRAEGLYAGVKLVY